MIDIKVAVLTGMIGMAAVDSGVPTNDIHNTFFAKQSAYTSKTECDKHVQIVERQHPELSGSLSCIK